VTGAGSDTFATATPIEWGTASAATPNSGLTTETGEPAAGYGRTAWWSFTPAETGWIALHTHASPGAADTVLSLYTGSTVDTLTLVATNDDQYAGLTTSQIVASVMAGVEYHVQVDAYDGTPTTYVLTAHQLTALAPSSAVYGPVFSDLHRDYRAPGSVVGSGAVWGDGSDATYVDLAEDRADPRWTEQGAGDFDAFSATELYAVAIRAALTTTTFSVRASVGDAAAPGNEDDDLLNAATPALSTTPGWTYCTPQPRLDSTQISAALAALAAGRMYVTVEPSSSVTPGVETVRVYDVRVLVAAPVSGYFDPPYLRNVQRGDGLGFSTAPRAFQNSTQQASLRNFGTF
jgi:hypothetical protein